MLHLTCPHCTSIFQIDDAVAAAQFTCPHCSNLVEVTYEHPPGACEPAEPPIHAVPEPAPPLPPPQQSTGPPRVPPPSISTASSPNSTQVTLSVDNDPSPQLSADERAMRKMVKNLIVWVCCAILLVIVLMLFVVR